MPRTPTSSSFGQTEAMDMSSTAVAANFAPLLCSTQSSPTSSSAAPACLDAAATATMGRPARLRQRSGEEPAGYAAGPPSKRQSMSSIWAPSEYRFGASASVANTAVSSSNGKSPAMEPPLSPTASASAAFCTSPLLPESPSAVSAISSSSDETADDAYFATQDAMYNDDCGRSTSSGRTSPASSVMSHSSMDCEDEDSYLDEDLSISDEDELPLDCFPSSTPLTTPSTSVSSILPPSQWTRPDRPFTFPGPTVASSLTSTDLESCLKFAGAGSSLSDSASSAPPAFFPLQRVSFAPQLKIKTAGGVPLALGTPSKAADSKRDGIAGMMLGVTGVLEVLDEEKAKKSGKEVVKTQRMIADFATDLTNGLKIWRRDVAPIVKEKLRVEREYRTKKGFPVDDLEDGSWDEMLAPGTFMLPLSMKIPCSEKLPPSFESKHYRIRYTMSLAVFSSRITADGRPEILHVHSVPFHILPSTLPTPAPHIPVLTHDARRGGFLAGLSRALSLSAPTANGKSASPDKTCTHIVCPSIPTTSYSPGSVIPITLKIADCPIEPTDLYIRLSLIRKIYVRDSQYEMMNEWGLPEEMFFEEFCKEEEEIVSRWGYVPYSVRAQQGATPGSKASVVISDITLPVGGPNGEWSHGYTSQLELGPTLAPSMKHGECSWFSPALSKRSLAKADYERYVHTSARHYISIEVGFANDKMVDVLSEIGDCVPDMEIPGANSFTVPRCPTASALSGLSTTNPFPVASPASGRNKKSSSSSSSPFSHAPQLPAFPGKIKEILIPITIGSVAEPQMSCIIARAAGDSPSVIPPAPRPSPSPVTPTNAPAATAEQSAENAARDADESEVERYERVGDDGEEAWLCPPPSYKAAVASVPAYV